MLFGVLIFLGRGFYKKQSSYTNAAKCGGRKGKLFCNFWIVRGFARIANVLAFVRWLGRHYATFVLSNLNVCATVVIVRANVLFALEYILSNVGYVLVLLAHILFGCGLVCYGLLYGLI